MSTLKINYTRNRNLFITKINEKYYHSQMIVFLVSVVITTYYSQECDILQTDGKCDMKSYCIPATYHKENTKSLEKRNKTGLMVRVWQFNSWWQWDRVYSPEWKSVSLSANGGGRGAKTGLYEIQGVALRNRWEWKRPEYNNVAKANSMTTVQTDSMVSIPPIIRKLTPIECERLQTLPDNYTEWVSNTQRYKAIGNWWTVDVIAHIFKNLCQ